MKKKVIIGSIVAVIVIVAVIIFGTVFNNKITEKTGQMEKASLPVISFQEGKYKINTLLGYTESKDITSTRDMVLPVSVGTTVQADISGYEGKIKTLTYEICTLDGKESIKQHTIKEVKENVRIELGDTIADGEEKILKIKLTLDTGKDVFYYTRVLKATEFHVQQCLEFAEDFHKKTFDPEQVNTLKPRLERSSSANLNSFQKVTLNSDIKQIGWNGLNPEIVGDVAWQIKESTETYTSIYLKYQVNCKIGEEKNLYNVTEFFKVRFIKGKGSLEDYERTMNEVFLGKEGDFSEKGIELGIADENVPYILNEKENMISFVQEREVWSYNKEKNQVSLVFSFADEKNNDIRSKNDNHKIDLISMDDKGNITFVVCGYMNRGMHEGQVGASIYYFNSENNYVEEKTFIPSGKSGEIAAQNLIQLAYYSKEGNKLYAMFEGTLYEIDLETQKRSVLVKNLEEGQYIVSSDGKHIAYQSNGKLTEATEMIIQNLQNGKKYKVKAEKGEVIRPLTFVLGDAVYGIGKKDDIGKNVSGNQIIPLYKVEIRNQKNKVVKAYQEEETYVVNAKTEHNMITLERVKKSGDMYSSITQHYITNNKEQKEPSVTIETYTSETKGRVTRLEDAKMSLTEMPKRFAKKPLLKKKPVVIEFNLADDEDCYYVYGRGKLQGIYKTAGAAIVKADTVRGVVVTSGQTKVWERGNRQLRYNIDNTSAFAVQPGETSLQASLRQILEYEGKKVNVAKEMKDGKSPLDILNQYSGGEAVDLSGCTVEQLCYLIGKGTPVIGMTGTDTAILLVGYDDKMITYLNPNTSKKPTEAIVVVQNMTKGSQGTFFGYVK
ncbi:hypothetical protein [Faecalimonas sp.]